MFAADVPRWAAELTASHVVVLGASPDRQTVVSRAVVELPPGSLIGDVKDGNILDSDGVRGAIGEALRVAEFSGSDLT